MTEIALWSIAAAVPMLWFHSLRIFSFLIAAHFHNIMAATFLLGLAEGLPIPGLAFHACLHVTLLLVHLWNVFIRPWPKDEKVENETGTT